MNTIKYILIIVFLVPQIAEAIDRVYAGNMGDRKVEFYISAISENDFDIIYLDYKTKTISYLGLARKGDDGYHFRYNINDNLDTKDEIFIKYFDFGENKINSKNNYLVGSSQTFGDFKLEKKFEYNLSWPLIDNSDKKKLNEAKQLIKNTEFKNVEFLQRSSTKDFYFKVLSSKEKEDYIKIIGINIYSKKNGELLQTIKSSKGYIFHTFQSIRIGDFDFDGNKNDFSLNNSESYAVNVPQIYYIYDDSQNKYIEANLEGYSIQFDSENKTATSTKTCGDVFVDPMFIKLNKQYLFNKNKKKYDYQDQYCISYENSEEKSIDKKCTKKERLDCEKAVVEVGEEP